MENNILENISSLIEEQEERSHDPYRHSRAGRVSMPIRNSKTDDRPSLLKRMFGRTKKEAITDGKRWHMNTTDATPEKKKTSSNASRRRRR
jgi:hypothetical protein